MAEALTELARHTSSLIWCGFAFFAFWLLRDPLVHRLGEMTGLKAVGFELSFVATRLAAAAVDASRTDTVVTSTLQKRQVQVTRGDRERVLRRAERCRPVLEGKRVLWIDDSVTNNRKEHELPEGLGLKVEQVQSNAAAEQALGKDGGGYDLILSDIARPDSPRAGLDFLDQYRLRSSEQTVPLILYIAALDERRPVPAGAFGLTNRPDALLHLVIDALERTD